MYPKEIQKEESKHQVDILGISHSLFHLFFPASLWEGRYYIHFRNDTMETSSDFLNRSHLVTGKVKMRSPCFH